MDVKKILESISNDVLNEDIKKQLITSFNEAVEAKVTEKGRLIAENELNKMDKEHTVKMTKLLEAMDADHVNKMKTVVEALDKRQTKKLQTVINKYDKELKESADALRSELIGKVSNYMDLYLESVIPQKQLQEAVENSRSRRMISEIKKIVAVDPEFIDENFKEALKDGHDRIEQLREALDAKIKENVDLNQSLISAKSKLILEQKTKDLPPSKKKFVEKLLEGKKAEEIKDNFQMVLEMYDRDEQEKIGAEAVKTPSRTITENIDSPKSTLTENIQNNNNESSNPTMQSYLEELQTIDKM